MVVVRRYTKTPYIPWESSCLPYLDMSTFSGGTYSAQFPLDWLHLWRLLPLLRHWGGLASSRGRDGVESVSPFPRCSRSMLRRGALPLWPDFSVGLFIGPSSPSRIGHSDRGRIGLSSSAQTSTKCQSNQRSAGVWVGPGNTGVSSKIQW